MNHIHTALQDVATSSQKATWRSTAVMVLSAVVVPAQAVLLVAYAAGWIR